MTSLFVIVKNLIRNKWSQCSDTIVTHVRTSRSESTTNLRLWITNKREMRSLFLDSETKFISKRNQAIRVKNLISRDDACLRFEWEFSKTFWIVIFNLMISLTHINTNSTSIRKRNLHSKYYFREVTSITRLNFALHLFSLWRTDIWCMTEQKILVMIFDIIVQSFDMSLNDVRALDRRSDCWKQKTRSCFEIVRWECFRWIDMLKNIRD